MRLIDADELNEYIGREALDTREKIFALVHRMPTVERLHGEWIPCSERLPIGSGEVLVTADFNGTLVVYSAWYNEMWEEFQRVPDEHIVIAWKELPEPYEGSH